MLACAKAAGGLPAARLPGWALNEVLTYLPPKGMADNVRNLHFRACSFRSSDSYLETCGPCLLEAGDSGLKIGPFLPSLLQDSGTLWDF